MTPFEFLVNRVEEKKNKFAHYGFERLEMEALSTFFDLAQEFDELDTLCAISVIVPRVFFGLDSSLYLVDSKTQQIKHFANSKDGIVPPDRRDKVPPSVRLTDKAYQEDDLFAVPIHGKSAQTSQLLFGRRDPTLGLFHVNGANKASAPLMFFLQKYVGRIGYNLYNRILIEQNIQHLKFINNIAADIEHNVISPNLRYRYYFRQIRKQINHIKKIEADLETLQSVPQTYDLQVRLKELWAELRAAGDGLVAAQQEVEQNYKHMSLFMESLFRSDHFSSGEYILRRVLCNLWQDIVVPQLDHYRDQFMKADISPDAILQSFDESKDVSVRVDKGLIAQVIANFFSNAIKYAKPTSNAGEPASKRVSCAAQRVGDFLAPGKTGIRFEIYTSGKPIRKEDSARVFEEGFRVAENMTTEGSGHGLHFVRNVIEVHGGVVGHESDNFGNRFFFVIPA